MAAEEGVGAAGLATGGEVAGKATAKTGQAAAEETDAAAAWSAGASGLATVLARFSDSNIKFGYPNLEGENRRYRYRHRYPKGTYTVMATWKYRYTYSAVPVT